MRIIRFEVSGYRCFHQPLVLEGLGSVVALYGLNNSGKTSLLRAIQMLGVLLERELADLLLAPEVDARLLMESLGQDEWTFTVGSNRPIVIRATLEHSGSTQTVSFEISHPRPDICQLRLQLWTREGEDFLLDARRGLDEQIQIMNGTLNPSEKKSDFDHARVEWRAMKGSAKNMVAWGPQVRCPVSDEVKRSVADAIQSADMLTRRRGRAVLAQFKALAQGLSAGTLDRTQFKSGVPDFGWETDAGVVPLDQLGSGPQAIFSMLSTLQLADANVICLDEPETHLGGQMQGAAAKALIQSASEGSGRQIFIATHSLFFARGEVDLRWLEPQTAGQVGRSKRVDLAIRLENPLADDPSPVHPGLVGMGHEVHLPDEVCNALDIKVGTYVYFVKKEREGSIGFELVTDEAMQRHFDEVAS